MREQTENETNERAEALERYGDVALGVECAWPPSIPVVQVVEAFSDASIRIH